MKFLPDIGHCVYRVLDEIWAPDSSHRIRNNFFIQHCQGWKDGSFVCETVLFFFQGEYSSVWPEICRVFSKIQSRFLRGILGNNYFGRIFPKFCANQGYPLPKLVKFRHTFCNFFPGPHYAKTQVPSCVVSTQVRRHVHKEITKQKTGWKSHDILFSEHQFCSLSVWDLLCLTPWVFWSEIFTRHWSLCLLSLAEIWAPD